MSGPERQFPRWQVKVPLYITADGTLFQKRIRLESEDVSGGGLAFETSQRLPLDAESRVVLGQLGGIASPAVIQARVVHLVRIRGSRRFRVGLEFTEFVNTSREEVLAEFERWKNGQGNADPDQATVMDAGAKTVADEPSGSGRQ